ncbi:MAG: M20 family metallopeptidase [Anaerolineales bacterium]|nr:M20 family metallopeptidase [Anaerolineales bacterium]
MTANSLSWKKKAWEVIKQREDDFRDLALDILNHPEPGYQETRASKSLVKVLAEEGFATRQPYGGLDTAFRAVRGKGEFPGIYFLAEYDALPGVGHGCGHNLIGPAAAAAAVGAAAVVEETGGSVGVIGTPAEEYLGVEEGKIKLLRAGAFQDVTAALMLHPFTQARVLGSDLGFIACEFNFHGQAAHAAADPWEGRNALEGLIAAFNQINALRQHLTPDVRVHGIIKEGGEAPNIVPDFASGQFMVRAADTDTLEDAYQRVCDCARAGALATGTTLTVNQITTVYNTRINPVLNRLIIENYEQLGIAIDPDPYPMAASTDFGNVSQELPAAMFFIDSHPGGIPWHSPAVAEASGEEKALQAMVQGACVLAGVAVDLLSDPGAVADMQKEFHTHD